MHRVFAAQWLVMRGGVVLLGILLLVAGCQPTTVLQVNRADTIPTSMMKAYGKPCENLRDADRSQIVKGDLEVMVPLVMCWLERNSTYRDLTPPRDVLRVDAQVLQNSASLIGYSAGRAGGVYRCVNRTMYLSKGSDFSKLWEQSVLVHEFVHHAQCVSGRWASMGACEREREAYSIQAQFVRFFLRLSNISLTDDEKQKLTAAADEIEKLADNACRVVGGAR